jgi:cytidylate kinase
MGKKIIIAIDGFSSCGKSTLARQLASALNYIYIDSGAMYRAVTLYIMEHSTAITEPLAIEDALKNITIHFTYNEEKLKQETYLNDKNVEEKIRDMKVSERVSDISTIPAVRDFLVKQQREFGKSKGIVMDGRDIGTVVFPKAELKIYLQADINVRTHRRYEELHLAGKKITLEEVKKNIEARDYEDSHRVYNPLRKADDAILLDNTLLEPDAQLLIALQMADEKINVAID